MADDFTYDVFLSHSKKNQDVVRGIAERLRSDGVRVWFDEWEIRPGDSIPAKVEEGLEHSRTLVLCMSAEAFGSDWSRLESYNFRFRDPLNKERRFIPVRLDDAPIRGSISQFSFIDWRSEDRSEEYRKIKEASLRLPSKSNRDTESVEAENSELLLSGSAGAHSYSFAEEKGLILSCGQANTITVCELETGHYIRSLRDHEGYAFCVAWDASGDLALSGGEDATIRLWEVESGRCLKTFKGHRSSIRSVGWSADGRYALSASDDCTIKLWHTHSMRSIATLEGHRAPVHCVAWSPRQNLAASGAGDRSVRVWDNKRGRSLMVLEGHTGRVGAVDWSERGLQILSGSDDTTIRLWDAALERCLLILEGHTDNVETVKFSKDGHFALSGSRDKTLRLWDLRTGQCLRVLEGHQATVHGLAWSTRERRAFSGDFLGKLRSWDLSPFTKRSPTVDPAPNLRNQKQYTNAKVLLVGNTGAGKTGLSNRLALDSYLETDSTVGAWATRWKIPIDSNGEIEKEIWLWDFGGQADQRLIHQLYMDQTQVAALVFDPQQQNGVLEGLRIWDRDLTRAATGEFSKLLVAGRIDAGGLRSVSRHQVEIFAREHGFACYLETSAKENIGCDSLKEEIFKLIDWERLAKRTTPTLFKILKEEIVNLKDEGRLLMRFNELREALALRLSGVIFSDDELHTVVSLLAGPGVVWELGFGSWVLLAPELINAYAQAAIRTIQEDEQELGCIAEDRVLGGKLSYPSDLKRLPEEEERILLLAMHRVLVENSLCLSETTKTGTLLIFPSYSRRERPDLIEHPSVLVSYQFEGFLDDIYATLVVRLHRISPFETKNLWNGAADFETLTGRKLGIKLSRKAAGKGELLVYFDPDLPVGERMIFSRYIQEHLLQKDRGRDKVKRLRHWICSQCYEPVFNRERAMQRLRDQGAKAKIICVNCEEYVHLWDEMEAAFADPEIMSRVRDLEAEAARELDNESKERALVGEVISTVGLAGQISREFPVSDHGLDMEIEFKSDDGEATGRRLYLQLKSGDSYLNARKKDGAEVFKITKQRHVRYWMGQAYPVMLVVRNGKGEVRWMEIGKPLKKATDGGKKQVRSLVFDGERFDVMSVRRWRERILS